ncbi:hypothetical protein HMPREF1982_03905 [Clostridiales bacterium oral taxon 876 str. F0540]|nr:hypothetical protein HMPREF1982_03905 [Clostridiales bacterium oral taxon 876 str. F0540]
MPAKVVSERLGHSSINITTDLYSHVTINIQKEVADKIANNIFYQVLDPEDVRQAWDASYSVIEREFEKFAV